MKDPFHYCLFGLRLRSEIELPELVPVACAVEADVEIVLGKIPSVEREDEGYFFAGTAGAGFAIDGVASFWMEDGRRIILDRVPRAPWRDIRLYLLGSAIGVLLHQRGLLPLHANGVEIDGHAFVFLGRSGAGKSTLAAAFNDAGFRVIADDVCVIDLLENGRPGVAQGIPRLRLWRDALEASGRRSIDHQLSFARYANYQKYDVPIDQQGGRLPLAAIYRLSVGPDLAIGPLDGVLAAEALFANTYRGAYLKASGNGSTHWTSSMKLLGSTSVFDLARPSDLARVPHDLAEIIRHARYQIRV